MTTPHPRKNVPPAVIGIVRVAKCAGLAPIRQRLVKQSVHSVPTQPRALGNGRTNQLAIRLIAALGLQLVNIMNIGIYLVLLTAVTLVANRVANIIIPNKQIAIQYLVRV